MIKYSFIIVAYKDYTSLNNLIRLIRENQSISDYEILVHDNTPIEEQQLIEGTTSVSREAPGIGFGAGCNLLAKKAVGENLVFLNPDTEPAGDWLPRMERGFEAGYDAISVTSDYIAGVQHYSHYMDFPRPFVEVKLIIPIVMLVKAETFKEMDGFDESFFLGCEDLDFSWRMQLAKKRMGIATDVFIHHIGHTGFSQTPGRKEIIESGENRIREKLKDFYGNPPSSQELWGCKILATELKRQRLSVCMIVSDGDKPFLRDLFIDIGPMVDEVILVQTGEFQAFYEFEGVKTFKTFHFPWIDDFAAARNFALSKCTGDWVLWLDADDRVPEYSGQLIRAAMDKPGNLTALGACHFGFQVHNTDKDGNTHVLFQQPRLFPRIEGLEWGGLQGCTGKVHESYFENAQRLGLQFVMTDIRINHTGYSDAENVKKKQERNLRLHLLEPECAFNSYNIGIAYLMLEDFENADIHLRKALAYNDPFLTDTIKYRLAYICTKQDRMEEVPDLIIGSQKADSIYLAGIYALNTGSLEEAKTHFQRYLDLPDIIDPLGTNQAAIRPDCERLINEIEAMA